MSKCNHCHKALENQTEICEACGQPVQALVNTNEQLSATVDDGLYGQTNQINEKDRLDNQIERPKKKIRLILFTAILIFGLLIGYQLFALAVSPINTAAKFKQALEDQNIPVLNKLLIADHKGLDLDDASLQEMLDYYDENIEDRKVVVDLVKSQAKKYKNRNKQVNADAFLNDYSAFNLVQSGKFFTFPQYKVRVSPIYYEVNTSYKGTDIFQGKKKLVTADRDDFTAEVGPYLPGRKKFTAVHKSELLELETSDEVTNLTPSSAEIVYLNMKANGATILLPFVNGIDQLNLYVNDKRTDIDLLKDNWVRPILTDGSMKLAYEANFPWGQMKSEAVPLESTYSQVPFVVDKQLREELQKLIIQAEQERAALITSFGESKLTVFDEAYREQLIEDAKALKDLQRVYEMKYLGTDFDPLSFKLSYENNTWQIKATTTGYYESAEYYENSLEESLKKYEEDLGWTFTYNETKNKWYISDKDYVYISKDHEMIKHREKKPKLHTSRES